MRRWPLLREAAACLADLTAWQHAGSGSARLAGWLERMKCDSSPLACLWRLKQVKRDIFTIRAKKTPTRALKRKIQGVHN